MRINLRTKTIVGIALIEAVLLALLVFTSLEFLINTNQNNIDRQVKTSSELLATAAKNAVLSYDLATLNDLATTALSNQQFLYIKFTDANGTELVSLGNSQLLTQPFIADTDLTHIVDGSFDVTTDIMIDNHIYGHLFYGLDVKSLQQAITDAKYRSAIIALVEMALVALFSFFLGAYLTKQLKTLVFAAENIVENKYDYHINQISNDELGDVAHAFNKMLFQLRLTQHDRDNYEQQLLSLNSELEDRIELRNKELQQKVTELTDINHQLELTKEQLIESEKLASIGQLSAGIAHEINNPIGFVQSNLHTLKEYSQDITDFMQNTDTNDDIKYILEDLPELLNESIVGTNRIKTIVMGLKAFAHQGEQLDNEVDVVHVIEQALNLAKNEYKYHCKIETDFCEMRSIKGNEAKLIQVFTNLIVNAAQALPTKPLKDRENIIQISSSEHLGNIVVEVRDSGCGINKDQKKRIFEPFYTTKAVGQGTGLGLSISYGIIKDHHGSISVVSSQNIGTRFIISLPIFV
jgi:two-component system, NtrC family, sensor kinase